MHTIRGLYASCQSFSIFIIYCLWNKNKLLQQLFLFYVCLRCTITFNYISLLFKLCVSCRFRWQLFYCAKASILLFKTSSLVKILKHSIKWAFFRFQAIRNFKKPIQYPTKQNNNVFRQDVNPLHYTTSVRLDINSRARGLSIMNIWIWNSLWQNYNIFFCIGFLK